MNIKIIIQKYHLLKPSEKVMILMGVFGLFPFIFGLIDIWINNENFYFLINIPKNYGTIILAFLGGIYWGIALNSQNAKTQNNKLRVFLIIWSILPSMLCIYVLSMKQIASVLLLSFGFLLSILVDEIFNKYLRFPIWYLFLRRSLSLLVILILITSYFILKK